jgi:FAD/FMN-containing dehydrogenase
VGTEGTCAIVLEATLRLVHSPPERALVLVGYPDIGTAGDEAPQVMQHEPLAVECIDETLVRDVRRKHFHSENVRLLTEGDAWLLVEIGGEDEEDLEQGRRLRHGRIDSPTHPECEEMIASPSLATTRSEDADDGWIQTPAPQMQTR